MTPPVSDARVLKRPADLDGLEPGRSAVIEASAGTGKTYLLEHLVLDLLITGRARLEDILIVTFTERATAELVTRIRNKIDQALGATATAVIGWTIDDAARARLWEARRSFDQATIATIHAFCQRIISDEAFATRRLLGQTQVDGRQVFGEVFRDVLRHTLTTDKGHRRYLEAYLGSNRGVEALEDLLYKAATGRGNWAVPYDERSLEEALAAFVEIDVRGPALMKAITQLGTRAPTVLKNFTAGHDAARTALRDRDWGPFLGFLDGADKLNEYFEKIELSKDTVAILSPLRRVVTRLLDAAPPLMEAVAQRFSPLVEAEVRRRKLAEGLYDYDDMIRVVDETLQGDLGPGLVDKLRQRYRFALVDEAQDTEPAQWRIFRKVFLDSGGQNPVILIGDPKQAIYGFRGADVHTYIAAREEIRARNGTFLALATNHRSPTEMVEATNAILDDAVLSRYFEGEGIRYDHPVVSGRGRDGTGPGVSLLEARPSADDQGPVLVGAIRRALRAPIAAEIRRLRASDIGFRLSTVFVLTRTNAEAQEVAATLRDSAIPSALYKQDYLFDTPEAEHLRALLLAIADPGDRAARMRAWLTPFFDLSLEALAGCADPPADHPAMARLSTWNVMADARAYTDLWNRILDDSGVTRRLRLVPSGQRRLTNYRHLFDVLAAEVAGGPLSLEDLAALLASRAAGRRLVGTDEGDTQRVETEREAVQIMTIHKAKGLEADHVFVYGGLIARRSWQGIQTLHRGTERLLHAGKPRRQRTIEAIDVARREEDQRELYVAMTRARTHLYLPFFPAVDVGDPESRLDGGGDFDPFQRITGGYRNINQRLRTLEAEHRLGDLFARKPLSIDSGSWDDRPLVPEALARWTPPAEVLGFSIPDATQDPDATARLRARRRGFRITSYSRLKDAEGGYQPPAADLADDDLAPLLDSFERMEVPATQEAEAADPLPGGAASGLFLHAVLEKVALGALPPLEAWRQQPEVRRLLEAEQRRWDRDPTHIGPAARLVHAALTAPISMPDGAILPGMARAPRVRREVDFLFRLPDGPAPSHTFHDAPWEDGQQDRIVVERGFVRGFLDVLFEHAGRICFADWKSDVLPAYNGDFLRAHVKANYDLQARLYTLAVVRMLGISDPDDYDHRFGGLVYLFLRGLPPGAPGRRPGDGLYVRRPDYDEVVAWDRDLGAMRLSAPGEPA